MNAEARSGLESLGATALGIAFARAQESARPDRLFDDPYARRFVAAGAEMTGLAELMTEIRSPEAAEVWGFLIHHVAIRTRYLDDHLLDAAGAGCRQAVLVAAGLDTRGLRLPWPDGFRVFELDQGPVLEFKERVLGEQSGAGTAHRVLVPVDLREDWVPALAAAGYDPEQPAAWLVEGLFPALTAEQSDALVARLSAISPPGSRLAYDDTGDTGSVVPLLEVLDPLLVELWQGGPAGDPVAWLAGHGWEAVVEDQADLSARYGRPAPTRPESGIWPRPRLVHARRP